MFDNPYIIPCLYAIICFLAGGMIAVLITLAWVKNKLKTIYEAITLNIEDVNMLHKDVRLMHCLLTDMDKTTGSVSDKLEDVIRSLDEGVVGELVLSDEADIDEIAETPAFKRITELVEEASAKFEKDETVTKLDDGVCGDVDGEDDVPSGYSVNPEDIHLITKEEYKFGRKLEYDHYPLIYFEKEGTLSEYYQLHNDAADTYNVTTLIGDGLRFFGVSGSDPNVVYIRNHILKTDFEVTKFESREAALRFC